MRNKFRVIVVIVVFFAALFALPIPAAARFKTFVYSGLIQPISFSKGLAQFASDLFHFRKNANELTALRQAIGGLRAQIVDTEELRWENQRLRKLLELRVSPLAAAGPMIFCRIVAKFPSAWSKTLLIDKGSKDGVRLNHLVLSESSLLGKVVEVGPRASKVLQINDPGFRLGVLVQRTRQQGVLFGALSGECRVKYLSVAAELRPGDVIETAGFYRVFPKGILVGKVKKAWKEPGQIYQVAEITPFVDFGRIEEAVCVGPAREEDENE